MGGLISKVTSMLNGSEPTKANANFTEEPYDEFVMDVLNAIKTGNYERLKQLQEEARMMLWEGIETINITPSVIQTAAMHGREDILQCEAIYIGRTERQLHNRVLEHIPNWVDKILHTEDGSLGRPTHRNSPASSVVRHVLESGHVVERDSAFRVLFNTPSSRLLRFAEAIVITLREPALCKQKDIYLIDLGIDIDQTDICGMTALHEACKSKHYGCVQLLVNRSRNIDVRDVWGRTPLIKALVYRNTKAAELLLERGANPNAVDIYGMTPLSTAIDYNLIDMLKVLVRHGADINLITQHMYKCSGPPLYQAINNQNLAMVNELIQLGANTQPRPQDYSSNSHGSVTNAWHYFSGSVSLFPTLQHANAVIMAMSEFVKRSHNVEISGPGMDILMVLISAHGHPLSSYFDVMIRVLINSYPNDFSMLLHKLEVCSSNSSDFLTGSGLRESNQRQPQARPQHLQQLDQHLRRANGGKLPPRFVMPLENQARKVARQAVMASGRNVVWAVKRLQCPPALKSLLLLKDIDKAFSPPFWKVKPAAVLS